MTSSRSLRLAVGIGMLSLMMGGTACEDDDDGSPTMDAGVDAATVDSSTPDRTPDRGVDQASADGGIDQAVPDAAVDQGTPDALPPPDAAPSPDVSPDSPGVQAVKAVYTASNEPAGNKIFVYTRAADGSLTAHNSFDTGGTGSGTGLGNQNGLIFDSSRGLFFVVNAGNDSLSMMSLRPDGSVMFLSKVPSGGVRPVSVSVFGNFAYVVNAGDEMAAGGAVAGNISGFTIANNALAPLAGSTQPLSAANPAPAQIQFTPDGKTLVVTEKATNMIVTYEVSSAGLAGPPKPQASAGMTPFGFGFSSKNELLVSEAFGGMPNKSAMSSYRVAGNGTLSVISSFVATSQTAACWVAVAGDFVYTTNTGSHNISGYRVAPNGAVSLLHPGGLTAASGMGPIDLDFSDGNEFLYVLNARDDSISIYKLNADGSLTRLADFTGLPLNANGLVAR